MNWGTKLIIGMLCFMSFIMVLVVKMINSKSDALVDTDYYEKGLAYDEDYKRKEHVKADNAAPVINITDSNIQLTFKDNAEGDLKLVRNSDQQLDQKIAIKTDALKQVNVPLKGIEKGHWRLIISWNTDGKTYLNEQDIMIP